MNEGKVDIETTNEREQHHGGSPASLELDLVDSKPDSLLCLKNMVANGFNAKRGDFLPDAIFVLSYDEGQDFDWNGKKRALPDQVKATTATRMSSTNQTLLLENEEDYNRAFSATMNAKYTGITWSGSLDSKYLYHDELFMSSKKSYALNFIVFQALSFDRKTFSSPSPSVYFTPAFNKALLELPDDIATTDNLGKYFTFFDTYGTHYADRGSIGGYIVMATSIEDSVFKSSSTTEIKNAISAGYDAIYANAKYDLEIWYESSKFLRTHRNEIKVKINAMGGSWAPGESLNDWQKSVIELPAELANVPAGPSVVDLHPVSDIAKLMGLFKKESIIIDALRQYLASDQLADGLLGRNQKISFGKAYDPEYLAGDGFIIATITGADRGERGYIEGVVDQDQNPITSRGKASQQHNSGRDRWLPSASMTIPSPKADTFALGFTGTSGRPSTTAYWVGLGTIGTGILGRWQDRSFETSAATNDGFLVAWIDGRNEDGARGSIKCERVDGASRSLIAAASQHNYSDADTWIPCNSFCAPVRKGATYSLTYKASWGHPDRRAYYLPLTDNLFAFGDYATREPNRSFVAKTDGFLIACLAVTSDGDRGSVDLYSAKNPDDLTSLGLMASTSVHLWSGSNIDVSFNTATIPVAKGYTYEARLTISHGAPTLSLRWIPLEHAAP